MKSLKLSITFLLFISILGCRQDDDMPDASELPKLIGHGGFGFQSVVNDIPPNTAKALEYAIEKHNIHGVEIDIQLSADNIAVLYHDKKLETQTNCIGAVRAYQHDFLKSNCVYQASSTVTDKSELSRIITLEYVFKKYAQKQVIFFLDIKLDEKALKDDNAYIDDFTESLTELISRFELSNKLYIESTHTVFLNSVREQLHYLKLMYYANDFESGYEIANRYNYQGIVIRHERISKSQVQTAQSSGLKVCLFGFRSARSHRESLKKRPDYIQTDDVRLAVKMYNSL
jgi:glycerophosphoryl diester phosphodiesterase